MAWTVLRATSRSQISPGQHDRYLFNQLQAFKSGKRTHKEMRYMSRQLTDEEMTAVSQYYANMPH